MKKVIRNLHVVLLSLFMILGSFTPVMAESKEFDEFMEEETNKVLDADFTAFHYGVMDYEKFDIPKPEVKLPTFSYEGFEEATIQFQESLDLLHQFDYDTLDERQQHDYQVYENYLITQLEFNKYPDLHECYNPYNGLYENIVTFFTEYFLYDKESAEDYLTLMADYPRMITEMNEFTKQQAAKGYFMSDDTLDLALQSMQGFIDTGEENPYIIIYNQKIDKLEGLTDEEKESYKERNRDLVLNTVYPAIQNAQTVLESLRGSRKVSGSMYEYEDGKAYYEALANDKCSSHESLDEKRDYLAKCLTDAFNYSLTHVGDTSASIDMDSPEEMLEYLGSHMEDFPKGPEIHYTLSYLDPCVANPSIIAYFVQPPLDDYTENIIRINGDSVNGNLNKLYRTLAHEGYPGHMYQFTWYYSQPDTVSLRHVINDLGYVEGWGQYVPRIMLLRSPLNSEDSEFFATNLFISYVMPAYIDILVNGYGYDVKAVKDALAEIGFEDMEDERIERMVNFVSNAPSQQLTYGYGMCKFWELNERVHTSLGDDFDLEDFHLQILKYGPRSFEIVESDLQKYVEGKGAEFVEDFTLFEHSVTEGTVSKSSNYIWILAGIAAIIVLILLIRKNKAKKKEDIQ